MIDLKRIKTLFIDGQEVKSLSINNQIVWQKKSSGWKGLKIVAEEDGSTVYMYKGGNSTPNVSLMYSLDDGQTWNDFVVCSSSSSLDGTIITLPSGFGVCFKAGEGGNSAFATSVIEYNGFKMTGSSIKASGNINSLLDGDNFEEIDDLTGRNYCFARLFFGCGTLVDASELQLTATTLATYCYQYMFQNCTSLTQAPELPATTLKTGCYYYMFYNCRSLTQSPELPATTLADRCYNYMFYGCTSLIQAPELPATTLKNGCYSYMFQNCSSLNKIKLGYTGDYNSSYFNQWVSGVPSTGTFYYNGSDTTRGVNAIPNGWTVQTF